MTKSKNIFLKLHIALIVIIFLNFLLKTIFEISLNYQLIFLIKMVLCISGIVLFFFYLKPFKKKSIYFSFYILSPIFIFISWLIDGIFGAILGSIFLFFFSPDDSRLENSEINIYKKFGGLMGRCCNYEVTEPKLFLFEKKIADFSFEDNLYFKKQDITKTDKEIKISLTLKEYNFENDHYFAKDSTITIPIE